jgi:ribosome maturation factor RimP
MSVTTQDEELVVTERSRGLPSPPEVVELLVGVFMSAGFEIDRVGIDATAHPARITVVADGDTALDLDTLAELSRDASDRLDSLPGIAESYVLEVTSPGVDRPLTTEKHFRRAHGRKVAVVLRDGVGISGRVAGVGDGWLRLVVRADPRSACSVREVAVANIARAVVQVEFSPPSRDELDLVGSSAASTGTEA